MRMLPQSIRARVVMLIVAISLPLIGVLLWGFIAEVNRQHAEAQDLALRIARSVAIDIRDSNSRAGALLTRMAMRSKIQRADPGDCDSLFSITDFFPQYPNLVLYDLSSKILCSASPAPEDVPYSAIAESAIAAHLRLHGNSANEPLVVLARDRWISVDFQPVTFNGRRTGTLALMQYIDLDTSAFPPETVITISNAQRQIIARSREGKRFLGQRGSPTIADQIVSRQAEGRMEAVGIDGVSRQYGFAHVPTLPWIVFAGLPSGVAMAAFRSFLFRGVFVGLVILGLVALLAIRITRTIERPLAVLTNTVKRAGDAGFNEQVPVEGPREIRVMAQAFNGMVRSRSAAEEALVESTSQLEALSKKLIEVQEDERSRIAREIHDELGQLLTALNMDVGGLLNSAGLLTAEQQGMARRIRQVVSEMLSSVQRISAELRPAMLDDFGLIAAIELELEKFEQRTGIECDLSVSGGLQSLGSEIDAAIYRIVQEAMTNVARHSDATRVEIRLRCREDELVVEVRDNGRGILPAALQDRTSIGLIGMRERARGINGTLQVQGVIGHGTIVSLSVPLARRAAGAQA